MSGTEMLELTPWDPTRYLTDDEAIEVYFNDAWESESQVEIADAIAVIAKAKGPGAQAAITAAGLPADFRDAPVDWDNPPEWGVLLRAIKALGLKLTGVVEKPAA